MISKHTLRKLIKECIVEVLTESSIDKASASELQKINNSLRAAKLDGNGRFIKKEQGLQVITHILDQLGFQLDMVSGDIIMGDKGSRMLTFRRKNQEGQDPFTEQPQIENSRIVFTWENLSRPGTQAKFEILAYAS